MTQPSSSPCKRGCCWSPYTCARKHQCPCHTPDLRAFLGIPTDEPPVRLDHRDPTPDTAIRNIMRAQRRRQ